MSLLVTLSEFMFMVGLFTFFFSKSHYLMLLFSLEFIMLSLFVMLSVHLCSFYSGFDFMFIFISYLVMEGVLGLCLLIFYSKSYGNDVYGFGFFG